MNASFRKSFARDLKKIKEQPILDRVRQAIEEVEAADTLEDVSQLKKMNAATDCYRIRVGDYRIGIHVHDDVVEFVRCLPRKDLYKYFP